MRGIPNESNRWMAVLVCAGLLAWPVVADESLQRETREAQQRQAELQAGIDAADDETREMLSELRQLESETRRLDAYNTELERVVQRQADTLERRETALESADATRETLPPLMRALVARLGAWVDSDLPFLHQERQARVSGLEQMLEDPDLGDAERLDRILGAWRAELNYGREMDAWRGMLDEHREVDFLRFGRVGFYYLTPDGRQGAVWRSDQEAWVPLEKAERRELRMGLRIARDQRSPELLSLPVSQPLTDGDAADSDEGEGDA